MKKFWLYPLPFVIVATATMFVLKAVDMLIDKLVYINH